MSRRLAAAAIALGVGGAVAAALVTTRPDDAFLDRYVSSDGRVVRHDEGGDTVSEGQAYALLVAAAHGDAVTFERVWSWTQRNLQRPDGLFAWRWSRGRAEDTQPAADADLDMARALLVASERLGRPELRADAMRVAAAVLEHETEVVDGRRLLLPGPWAAGREVVNPSYLAPKTFAMLEDATGDRRWGDLRSDGIAIASELLRAEWLPPDWASVDGHVSAVAGPDRPGPAGYGFEAARFPVRFAEACDAEARRLAARTEPGLRARRDEHTVHAVAWAAALHASGRTDGASRALDAAEDADRRRPTYYGAAWVALARAMLDGTSLGRCS